MARLKSSLKKNNLTLRLLSTLVIAPLALLAVWLGGIVYVALVIAMAMLGLREWLRLVNPNARKYVATFAYGALLLILILGVLFSPAFGIMLGMIFALLLFLLAAGDHEGSAAWVTMGIPYMAGSGLALLWLRDASGTGPGSGRDLVFYLLAVVWGTDTGAYIAGRLIGGPKLLPNISPSKTWAGLFGGMVLAAAFGYGVAAAAHAAHPWVAPMLAMTLAVVSQMGDLFESYVKRRSGVKESGALIPGHGGVLDRIDGLIFAAIFFVLFQVALGAQMEWW
jgi:phosphatidate cytidylyltransferase